MTAGCEGGCGCVLTGDGWEWVRVDAPMVEHTVERCRVIRTMREAGVVAAPPDATVEIRDDRDGAAFGVWVSGTASYPPPWGARGPRVYGAVEYSIGLSIDAGLAFDAPLDQLGVMVEENLRRALEHPEWCSAPSPGPRPVIARDPYAGRGGSS